LDLGDDVIQMINISSGTLEACLKTYMIKQSSRHKKETEPDARIAKKQSNGQSTQGTYGARPVIYRHWTSYI